MTAPLPLLTEAEVNAVISGVDEERRSFGCLRCETGLLPLKALDVDVRIIGTFAHTRVTQTFVNTSSVPVEATYIFPLPDRAAATRFVMEVAGRRVEGDLQERGQARQTYDNAIRQGKRASIAEEERPGTFTLRVGNLLAGESATITLELSGPLTMADGEVTYRFPLVVAPRYIPGTALGGDQVGDGTARDTDAVPDASRISPPVRLLGFANPVRLGIRATIDAAGLPLSNVRSALHAAWANERDGLLEVKVGEGERLDRDFILRFQLGDGAMRTSARASVSGGDDAFVLTVLPAMTAMAARPRDIVFCIDRSGSMEGWKMIAARRSVARMVDSLRPADRFCVIAFDDRLDVCPELGDALAQASDRNRYRATEWLATVKDRGGTEMAAPLSRAADLLSGGALERDRVLVFVTDGQVGNETQLMKLLGKRLQGVRVFALGIDQAVNAGFMNRLAALGRQGEAELVETEDRVDEVLTRCHRRIDTPMLRDLQVRVEGGALAADTLAPSRLPDVFEGVPAVIVGKLRRAAGAACTIVVTGVDRQGGAFSARVPVEASANPALLPAWGRLHLRDLEDRYDGHQGNRQELAKRIVQVSLETKVLCRFTAFVAVDHEVVNEGGRVHKVTQAVDAPAGWGRADASAKEVRRASAPVRAKRMMVEEEADEKTMPSMRLPMAAPDEMDIPSGSGLSEIGFDDEFEEPTSAGPPVLHDMAPEPESVSSSAAASSSVAAPPPPAPARKPVLGAVFEKMERMVSRAIAPAEAKAKAEVSRADASPDLSAYASRLRDLVDKLEKGDTVTVRDQLTLLVEELAHAGVPPAKRQPLVDALAALTRGDVNEALRLLRPLCAAGTSRQSFWS